MVSVISSGAHSVPPTLTEHIEPSPEPSEDPARTDLLDAVVQEASRIPSVPPMPRPGTSPPGFLTDLRQGNATGRPASVPSSNDIQAMPRAQHCGIPTRPSGRPRPRPKRKLRYGGAETDHIAPGMPGSQMIVVPERLEEVRRMTDMAYGPHYLTNGDVREEVSLANIAKLGPPPSTLST